MTTEWRKSSRSSGQGGQCVEARRQAAQLQLKDSKLEEASPILSLSRADFQALISKLSLVDYLQTLRPVIGLVQRRQVHFGIFEHGYEHELAVARC